MNQPRIGVVIATYGRPKELRRALAAIGAQSVSIKKVVVVDSSRPEAAIENGRVCAESTLAVTYLTCDTPSSTVQRNVGIKALLESGVDFVQVLDDDTMPAGDYIERLLRLIENEPGSVGASGVTKPDVSPLTKAQILSKFIFALVGLESFNPGSVSLAGCGIPVNHSSPFPQQADWLFGCSLWRSEVFNQLEFNPRLRGAALAEDLDFSILARRLGKLWVDPLAHLHHSSSPLERPNEALYGYRFARNRWFVVSHARHPLTSRFFYVVSNLFLSLVWLASAFRRLDKQKVVVAGSYIRGMVDAFKDKAPI